MRFAFWKRLEPDATRHVCETCKRVASKELHATNSNLLADGTNPPAGWVRRVVVAGVLGMHTKRVTFCATCWRSRLRARCEKNLRRGPHVFWRNWVSAIRARRETFEALRPITRRRWKCGEWFVPAS